jgi:hypothetical protein
MEDRQRLEDCVWIFVILYFVVGVPLWMWYSSTYLGGFRTEMKKGARRPVEGAADNVTNSTQSERSWVYLHDQLNNTRYSPEQLKYMEARAAIEKRQSSEEQALITFFEGWYEDAQRDSPESLADTLVSDVLEGWFSMRTPGKNDAVAFHTTDLGSDLRARIEKSMMECWNSDTACESRIYGHLHYGEDDKLYYDARNAQFFSKHASFVRVILIDVVQPVRNLEGVPHRVAEILPVFYSEHPLTDEAWVVDHLHPDDESLVELNTDRSEYSTIDYTEFYPEMVNYIHSKVDGAMGIRISEVIGVQESGPSLRFVYYPTQVIILEESKQATVQEGEL